MIKYNTTETAFSYAKTHEITSTKSSSTGFMMLGVGGDKPNRNTKGNTLCFVVVTGQVEVLIHKSTVVCGVGTQFNVPSGNQYRLCNKGDVECRLFWVCFSPK